MNFTVTKYPQGTFCWADNSSTNVDAAKRFYQAVMGWGVEDIPIGSDMFYSMFSCQGKHVAAISAMQPEMQAQGIPSHWNSYISVDNVDTLAEKVITLGGKVVAEPFDVFDSGRMMVIQDPSGATVSLWQPKNHIGASLVNTPGAMIWNELGTHEPQLAQEFFGALLGWTFKPAPQPGYVVIYNNGRGNGGIITMTEEWKDIPPHWMVYFSVEDIEATLEKVKSNGGQAHFPIISAGVGRFTVVSDPAGAHFTVFQAEVLEPWIE